MTTLLEDPVPAIVCGSLVEIVLLVVLWRTGRGVLLAWMAGVAMVVGALVLLERLVVTDREQIQIAVESARAGLEANDSEAVLVYIAPDAQQVRRLVETAVRHYTFSEVRIFDMQITFGPDSPPDTAEVHISGLVALTDRSGKVPAGQFGVTATVALERIDGRWLVTKVIEARQSLPGLPAKKAT